ncbi:MAG: methylaspartate ammonia-lyase [Acholeplasmataceae bacterium]|jgi:methylaspartate ammonia-lyase|nr:methylaspartate ammonia-lyase [Acholeplasmataceae bacterium]
MKILDVVLTKSNTGFYYDDQVAMKQKGVTPDGLFYLGEPLTAGFTEIRMPGEAISIQLILENKLVAVGDCAAVQYSGASGRDPLFLAEEYLPFMEEHIKPLLIGEDVSSFKVLAQKYDNLLINGKRIHTAIRYGVTQALLMATALSSGRTAAEVLVAEYELNNKLSVVPVFTQTGDDRYLNADKMILKEVDSLPHALINNVEEKLGLNGEILLDYVGWLKARVIEKRKNPAYKPIFHFDVYGTIGMAFNNDIKKIVDYLELLENAAKPFKVRVEGPVDVGSREKTMLALKAIRALLTKRKLSLEIVVDEWCNNLEDIKYFADHQAGHIIQIKTPDLGGLNNVVEAALYCQEKKMGVYIGGTCNETNISSQVTANVAVAVGADLILAKPGMGVDEGLMIVKNEMVRVVALNNRKF